MPVVGIQTDLLLDRLGPELAGQLDPPRLVRTLERIGCDVEGMGELRRLRCERCGNLTEHPPDHADPVACDRCGVDFRERPELLAEAGSVEVIRMELLAVRPDIFDPGGLARMLRGYLLGEAAPSYPVDPPRLRVEVDPAMGTERCPRPAIACAVVRGVRLDDDLIKVLMKLQENLHWALGRDRKHASIGVYDLDRIAADGPLRYRPVEPDGLRFVPLGHDPADPAAAITPAEVLEVHPKGRAYRRLVEGWPALPLLEDARGGVLALIPIINSEHTRVRPETTSFFIDVTGTGERIVGKALNVLVTSLVELMPGARIEGVTVARAGEERVTPDLAPQRVRLDPGDAARRIGLDLDRAALAELLRRMGHGVRDPGEGPFEVAVPAWRNDVLHPVDLVEDAAIAYGYHNIAPRLDPTFTVGAALPVEERSVGVREAMAGLGFQEVMTLQLTSEARTFEAMRLPVGERHVLLANPISADETMLRTDLLPGLLGTLAANTHRPLPQRIFEVGDVSFLDAEAPTGAREVRHVAGALCAATAGFADLRPAVEALFAELGWGLATEPDDRPSHLPGRGARLVAVRGEERRAVGHMGELHPEVLEAFHLRHPVVAFEADLTRL